MSNRLNVFYVLEMIGDIKQHYSNLKAVDLVKVSIEITKSSKEQK
jgi:hypothetical protein